VAQSLNKDIGRRELVRDIEDTIGLTSRQGVGLMELRDRLEEEGLSPAEIDDEISARSDEMLDERAEMIAHTESMRAANEGQLELWDQAVQDGYLTGDEQKMWIATPDVVVCDECEALDGETVGLDEDFPDGDPPLHPFCRCTVALAGMPGGEGRETEAFEALGGPGSGNFGHAGRPGEVGGSASDGDASGIVDHPQQTNAERVAIVTRRCEEVARELGVDPKIVHVVDKEPAAFTVGNQQFHEAGHFDPRTGEIEINARGAYDMRMSVTNGIAAHEVSHAIYDGLRNRQSAEHAEINGYSNTNSLSATERDRLFLRGSIPRPEQQDEIERRWPVSAMFSRTIGDSTMRGHDLNEQMVKEDGHSAYAKSYWQSDLLQKTGGMDRAVNETLAEVTRYLTHPLSWHEQGNPDPKSPWVTLAKDMMAMQKGTR
jgi:SPP1 gp7 family putative phage head morphogenesis protein